MRFALFATFAVVVAGGATALRLPSLPTVAWNFVVDQKMKRLEGLGLSDDARACIAVSVPYLEHATLSVSHAIEQMVFIYSSYSLTPLAALA
jgi:hypothetical protein